MCAQYSGKLSICQINAFVQYIGDNFIKLSCQCLKLIDFLFLVLMSAYENCSLIHIYCTKHCDLTYQNLNRKIGVSLGMVTRKIKGRILVESIF